MTPSPTSAAILDLRPAPSPRRRTLTREEADALGRELDALAAEVRADLGERDVAHLRAVMRTAGASALLGRTLLHFGVDPVTFLLGSGALALAKRRSSRTWRSATT